MICMRILALGWLVVLLGCGASAAADPTITMVGEYVWNKGKPHALRAVFTPAGDGAWTVDFHFKHYGKHTFSGTASGDPTAGDLEGRVNNPKESREFTFSGRTTEGTFRGEHAELRKKGPRPTGTLTLRPEPAE